MARPAAARPTPSDDHPLPALVHDPERIPDGRRIRRITADIQGTREGHGLGAVVSEVWGAVVMIGLSALFVVGIASTLHDAAPEDVAATLTGEIPTLVVVLAIAGATLSLAGRLGPIGVGGAGAAWWLPMPVARRSLLVGSALVWPGVAIAIGVVLGPLTAVVLAVPFSLARLLAWAALGAGLVAVPVAAAALRQSRPGASARFAAAGDLLMAVAATALVGLALLPSAASTGLTLPVPGLAAAGLVLVAMAAGLTVVAERRAETIPGAELRASGAVVDRARAAVLSLDLRELGRTLTHRVSAGRRTRSFALRPGGPRRALLTADLVLLLRTPRAGVQVLVAALLAVAAPRTALLGASIPLYLALLAAGFWAAGSAAAGARHGELVPALDRLFPLSARTVRLVRGITPTLAATAWALVALGGMALHDGDVLWLAIAPAWGVALGAGAVRAAYRQPPRAPRLVVSSPMGGAPNTNGLLIGIDLALVATLPTGAMLFAGVVNPTLVALQWAFGLAAAALVVMLAGRRPTASGAPPS